MAELKTVDNPKKNRPPKKVGYLKMKVTQNLKSVTINALVKDNISTESSITTDAYPSYNGIKEVVKSHNPQVIKPKEAGKILP